jgi:hypothetical protein
MSKVTKEQRESLRDHPKAREILEVLESPVESWESDERKKGYVVNSPAAHDPEAHLGDPSVQLTVHRLSQWERHRGDAGAIVRYSEDQKAKRAKHGLEFLQRPNGKGPYLRTGRVTRAKVNAAYLEQHRREWKGPQES